jgi:hypothetical protein
MATLTLANYGQAIVDDADLALVSRYRWYAIKKRQTTYAQTDINGYAVGMHRIILGLKYGDGLQGDHRDGNGLDNRRANLRTATRSDNQRNQVHRIPKNGYRGIFRQNSGWRAQLQIKGKTKYIGIFPTKEAAALAYDQSAREVYGEFAVLNFPTADTAPVLVEVG